MSNTSKDYVEYDGTGLIIGSWKVSDEIYDLNKYTKNLIEGVGTTNTHYVIDGEIAERPPQQTTLTNSTLTNLPTPCTISINGTLYNCTDDTAELYFNQPVLYTISVKAFPYLDFETTYDNRA